MDNLHSYVKIHERQVRKIRALTTWLPLILMAGLVLLSVFATRFFLIQILQFSPNDQDLQVLVKSRQIVSQTSGQLKLSERLDSLIVAFDHWQRMRPIVTQKLTFFYTLIILLGGIGVTLAGLFFTKRARLQFRRLLQFTATLRTEPNAQPPALLLRGKDEFAEIAQAMAKLLQDHAATQKRYAVSAKIAAWQEFAKKLAHETNNALTPLGIAIEELVETRIPAIAGPTRVLENQLKILRNMIKHFSEFARLPDANLKEANLVVFLDHFLKNFRHDRRVIFCTDLPGSCNVKIDEFLLAQVLQNLIVNAVDATIEQVVRIKLQGLETGNQFELDIIDFGTGIKNEIAEKIFEAYFTTKATDTRKGTGLGLAISVKIINDHSGSLKLLSTSASGSTFRIEIPTC